jgi:hypothetical protein
MTTPDGTLALDGSTLCIKSEPGSIARIGSQEENEILGHADLDVCMLFEQWS